MKGRNCHFTKYGGGEYRARVLGGVHKYSMEVVVRQLWQVCAWKCGNCHFTQASVEPQMGIQTLLSPQNIRPHTKRDFFGKSNLESVYQAALNGWLSRGGGRESRVDSTITRSHSKRQWQPRLSRINVWNSPGKAFNAGISFFITSKIRSFHRIQHGGDNASIYFRLLKNQDDEILLWSH